jgi:hypothetical protein
MSRAPKSPLAFADGDLHLARASMQNVVDRPTATALRRERS